MKTSTQKKQGFSLLEVMVALAILATMSITLATISAQSSRNIDTLKQRQFALQIAHNQLNLYLLAIDNKTEGETHYAGNLFRWKIAQYPTDTENFNRIDIKVTSAERPEHQQALLTTFKRGVR